MWLTNEQNTRSCESTQKRKPTFEPCELQILGSVCVCVFRASTDVCLCGLWRRSMRPSTSLRPHSPKLRGAPSACWTSSASRTLLSTGEKKQHKNCFKNLQQNKLKKPNQSKSNLMKYYPRRNLSIRA